MLEEFKDNYANNTDGHTPENYLKMFKNIKENQIFYKTYFKPGFDVNYEIDYFDKDLAKKCMITNTLIITVHFLKLESLQL